MQQPLEIDPIVTKYLREEPLSPQEAVALQAWISQGKGRSKMLEELKTEPGTKANLAHMEEIPHARIWDNVVSRVQQDGYWQEDESEASVAIALDTPNSSTTIHWRRYAIAASLLLVTGATWWTFHRNNTAPASMPAVAKTTPTTDVAPGGNRATLTLADGRQINLDASATGLIASQGNTNISKLSAGQLAYNKPNTTTGQAQSMLYNILSTPRAGQFSLALPDGTKVWLNNASSLRYPVAFTGDTREVELSGEAYFEVAKDAAHPFRVHITSGPAGAPSTIDVLGTAFNIMAYSDEGDIRSTLVEGSIKYSNGEKSTLLKPEEQSVLDTHGNLHTLKHVNVDEVTAWKNGFFHFDHTNLQSTMRQLARWYDVSVSYEGTVPPQEFQGKIQRNMSLSIILKMLETDKVHFRLEGRQLTVMP